LGNRKQYELKGLTDEPHDIANKKISRREALSMASRIVIATSTTSLVAGFAGYFLGSSFKKEATRTLTETKYETITETKTEIKTETKYVTITTEETIDREKPVIKRVIHEKYGLIGSPYYVDIEATDNVGIESVIIEVLDPKGELSYYNAKKVERDIYRASFIPSVKGLYRAKAIVKDASGNVIVSESFKMITLTETEERLRRICQNERIFEKGYELVNDLKLSDRKMRNESLEALKNYSIALLDLSLPYERDGLSMLIEASEKNSAIVDFEPIVFNSIDGNNFVLTPNAGRETWMLARHMKLIRDSGFDILSHPEMFEGLNGKIIANAYSIFDAKYGINYAEQTLDGRTLKPADKDVWDLIMLQWNLYSNKAPQLGGGDKLYNRDFPWYDSDKLDVLYQDPNTRRQALLFLFHLDNGTFDMEKGKTVVGVEGARTALIQAEKEYEKISKLYPNGKVILPYTRIPADPRGVYYDWVNDRGFHGLWNTHIQFIGMDPQTLLDINRNSPYEYWGNPQKYVENYNGVDQYITKNWKYWDLVKFVMGHERWKEADIIGMIEPHTVNYSIPQTLKAFGFPTYFGGIEPAPVGAGEYEWVVSLPDYISNKLKGEFNDKIIIGPANGFGLYFSKDGLIKDGISEIFGFSGGTGLLADKEPSLGLGWNFRFYFLKK
jgi:hypothetical protein